MIDVQKVSGLIRTIDVWATEIGRAIGLLAARLWLAWIFFKAGLTKIANWDSTLYLFTDEYRVPLLPPAWAACLGTAAELVLPVFLALGLATRCSALALFGLNVVAVYSYWHGLPPAGVRDHVIWAILMLILILQGGGRASLDSLVCRLLTRDR